MLARVRSQPAWIVALAFGVLVGGLTIVADPDDHSVLAGVGAIVLLACLAIALYRRPDREGWAIYSVLLLPSIGLSLVGWPRPVEAAIYLAVATGLTALLFDRRVTGDDPATRGGCA